MCYRSLYLNCCLLYMYFKSLLCLYYSGWLLLYTCNTVSGYLLVIKYNIWQPYFLRWYIQDIHPAIFIWIPLKLIITPFLKINTIFLIFMYGKSAYLSYYCKTGKFHCHYIYNIFYGGLYLLELGSSKIHIATAKT